MEIKEVERDMRIVGFGQDGDLNLTNVIIEDDGREYWFENPRWISVEERLPEVDKRYGEYEYSAELLVYDGLRRRSAYYCHTSGVWYDSRYEDDTFEVTHYMPLPEPPKEETT